MKKQSCSICGKPGAHQIEGTYWMCVRCLIESQDEHTMIVEGLQKGLNAALDKIASLEEELADATECPECPL